VTKSRIQNPVYPDETGELEQVQAKLIRAERLAAVGELASGVGHELRNPLNVIRNCAYLLHATLDKMSDDETMRTLAILDKQVDIANKIITDLLDFTRVAPPAPVRIDLNVLVRESLSWVSVPELITVRNNCNGQPHYIRADAEQIGRVFTNIIANAFQSMNIHGGTLTVATGGGAGTAWARFSDEGCGIPAENLDKVFEPLFTTRHRGIGLGLAISRRLVEENGGKIEVASVVGRGTTFTVTLPQGEGGQAIS
jgi:signal transduction histidine kinase